MCILSDLCSCDYLKCFAGKEQQRWDRNTLLFRLRGEDGLSGRAFNKVLIRKPCSEGSVPGQAAPRTRRQTSPPALSAFLQLLPSIARS